MESLVHASQPARDDLKKKTTDYSYVHNIRRAEPEKRDNDVLNPL